MILSTTPLSAAIKISLSKIILLSLSCIISFNATNALASPTIAWYDWDATPFEQAKRSKKLIMVNVGHEGCVACRWMEQQTFTDPEVIKLLGENFISISVDSEARPDIGERYSDWAWPATAFMTPDGQQVLAIRGNRRPENFIPILQKLIKGFANGSLEPDKLAPYAAQPKPRRTALTDIRDQVRTQLDDDFDNQRGGWGDSLKVLEYAEPILQYFLRYHLESNPRDKERAIKTVNGFMQQTDPVWGGLFYVSFGQWNNVAHEKRIESQAAALQIFSEAYAVTKDPVYSDQLSKLDKYLQQWMRSKAGTFYASQKNDIPSLPNNMDSEAYYKLDDEGRRKYGLPVIDHAVYTDLNARIISAYVHAYEATGKINYLNTALTAADTLVTQRQTESGWISQFESSKKVRNDSRIHTILPAKTIPYLRTQAYFGLALLDLYRATSDKRWLTSATALNKGLRNLEDPDVGGFYASPADGTEKFIAKRKPLEDNAVAARFLFQLGIYLKDKKISADAIRTIRATTAKEIVSHEGRITGNLALTLEMINASYLEFTIVGDPNDPNAQRLYRAGLRTYEPRKIMHYEKSGRYPKLSRAAMYICNETACSVPIFSATDVPVQAAKFLSGKTITPRKSKI